MGEAFARHLAPDWIEASSAGLFPAPIIQPETIQVMAERQIEVEDRKPRSIVVVDSAETDLLVNMAGVKMVHLLHGFAGRELIWHVPDPIGRSLGDYRDVRDQIEERVEELVEELRGGNDYPG